VTYEINMLKYMKLQHARNCISWGIHDAWFP